MSDVPPGPGWWKASDGNWYPPDQQPGVSELASPDLPIATAIVAVAVVRGNEAEIAVHAGVAVLVDGPELGGAVARDHGPLERQRSEHG